MLTPDLPPLPQTQQRVAVRRVRQGHVQPASDDLLAEEVPVALEYNGISHATLLATPADLEDFARGFSYTEGIIDGPADIRGIDVQSTAEGLVVQLEIATAREVRLKERRRALAGRTGCGLCGVESLEDVQRVLAPLAVHAPLSLGVLSEALAGMRAGQALHEATGATHAAAWFDSRGRLLCLREDVGRHNALDKMIGATLRAERVDGFAVVSSRASFEMVQKSVAAGIHTLVAVSAPTALAARLAHDMGLLLLGFSRGQSATVYTYPERVQP
ncbi:formate dehydrogenase accessory sulfurtransferase FdhD [Verticiella sediminum]|uniref:Sulfur carrier protein FdhD n=1 Tax=Verticiella sediminum TaxID=1247510 RepID=A0A556A8H6_9BURK|nr:formate dehydrogenase accessory sulfurtransferase FdhD [Verticiella sediminum]TSH89175.1 formate dehydrogenase accessory sulfurtransferase FdhD [Verticiella sediminum]